MIIDIKEIVRKLVLTGIPLLPVSCDYCESRETVIEVENRAGGPIAKCLSWGDFSKPIRIDFYERCAEKGDCLPLCRECAGTGAVESCTLISPDGGANASRIGVKARMVYQVCETNKGLFGSGRRPEGLDRLPHATEASCETGAWLATAAYLEAASVPAFDRMVCELAAHGAPSVLIHSARRAAQDEQRHARIMKALARRFAATPASLASPPTSRVRSLEAVAIENAMEGCVRETVGALVAHWQGTWAADSHIRAGMRAIARDEGRHAELSWKVDDWAGRRLSAPARRRVRAARSDAFERLASQVRNRPQPSVLVRTAGMPAASVALDIVRASHALLADS